MEMRRSVSLLQHFSGSSMNGWRKPAGKRTADLGGSWCWWFRNWVGSQVFWLQPLEKSPKNMTSHYHHTPRLTSITKIIWNPNTFSKLNPWIPMVHPHLKKDRGQLQISQQFTSRSPLLDLPPFVIKPQAESRAQQLSSRKKLQFLALLTQHIPANVV